MPSSLLSASPADHSAALLAAVGDIAERCLFTFADPSDEGMFSAYVKHNDCEEGWIATRITFDGPSAGWFALTLPECLARRLAAAFAGLEDPMELKDDAVRDFAGELCNMACGSWLTNGESHVRFVLTPPKFLIGSVYADPKPQGMIGSQVVTFAWIEDAPVRMSVSWTRHAA